MLPLPELPSHSVHTDVCGGHWLARRSSGLFTYAKSGRGVTSALSHTNYGTSFRGFSIATVYAECKYSTKRLRTFYKHENKERALLLGGVCVSGNILIKTTFETSVFD
jgi:hypothetical protein